ncbi:MAG: hypothetical protein ABIG73_02400 [Patescibacteria group bacterium]
MSNGKELEEHWEIISLASLVGKDLKNFKIVVYTEVYKTNDDGKRVKSIGCFIDENIAKAFAQNQTDSNWHRTREVLILTDGVNGFLLDKAEPVEIFGDEKAILEIKQKALRKLSPEEIKVLGL